MFLATFFPKVECEAALFVLLIWEAAKQNTEGDRFAGQGEH